MKRYLVLTLMFFLLISCNDENNTDSSNVKENKGAEVAATAVEDHNHLGDETSPHLLQHADNPVNWYPYSEEALKKAKDENKLIFLSIGYSTCHWCQVL